MDNPLCPDPFLWRLSLISLRPDHIVLHLEPLRKAVRCPLCGIASTRVHSKYQRTAQDLPWSPWPVTLIVHSRKFFCDNIHCLRRIFTEPFPGVLERYARRTERLHKTLLELAYACSAEAAARAALWLGYTVSGDSLINWQRQESFTGHTPRILGVDEFSLRRGHTYATILVDLERHQPIEVLDGKDAELLAQWLQAHPGVAVVARDRSDAYALAARAAAPQAIQVADRFHLVHNVGEALKELLRSRRWDIPTCEGESEVCAPAPLNAVDGHPPQVEQRKATPRKQALWEAVQQRKDKGQSKSALARELGVNRKTIRRYLAFDEPPAYGPRPPHGTKLTPYIAYLHKRWAEGCHNARRLYNELRQQGYTGSMTRVKETVRPWRSRHPPVLPKPAASVYWLVLRPHDELNSEVRELEGILEANPKLAEGYHLKERFRRLVAERDVEALDNWFHEAANSGLKPFKSLAKGFLGDYEAVKQGLKMPWSTAQCEGQICRVKLIKRQGYGRAKLDLLRQRVLHRSAVA